MLDRGIYFNSCSSARVFVVCLSSAGTWVLSYGRRLKSHPWILRSLSNFSPRRQWRRRRNRSRTRSAGRRPSRWAEIRCYVCGSGSSSHPGKLFPWLSCDVCVQIPAPLPTAVSKCRALGTSGEFQIPVLGRKFADWKNERKIP